MMTKLAQLDKAVWLKLDEVELKTEAIKRRIREITDAQVFTLKMAIFKIAPKYSNQSFSIL